MKKEIKLLAVLIYFIPFVVFASGNMDLNSLIDLVVDYVKKGVFLIMVLAVAYFVYNVFNYFIKGSDSPGEKKDAGLYVMWSAIGFAVIFSMWGLVNIVLNTFQLNNEQPSSGFFGTFKSSNSGSSIFNGASNTTTNVPINNSTTNVPTNNSTTNVPATNGLNPLGPGSQ